MFRALALAVATRRRGASLWAGSLIVAALGVRTLWLALSYVRGTGTPRFQVESAAILLVLAGLTLRLARTTRRNRPDEGPSRPLAVWTLGLWWVLALMLYWPSLGIGFLSDDFVLAARAVRWQLGQATPELFRPLPLLVWGVLLRVGGGPFAIHLLNVLLHGTNAYLTLLVLERYVGNRAFSILGGLAMVAFPLSPEAVAWASGMFDVMATCFILTLVLIGRACADSPSRARRTAFFACGIAALLSKETAAVAPLLVLLDLWATGRLRSLRAARDALLLLMLTAVVGALRLAAASSMLERPITRYVVQRWIFTTFGNAALPWRIDVIEQFPWVAALGAITCVALLLTFFLWGTRAQKTTIGVSSAAWMLVATLPVATVLGVAPDLQGARYHYLSSIGWAGLLVALACADGEPRRLRSQLLGLAALAPLMGIYVVSVGWHLAPWRAAGSMRQAIEDAARGDPRLAACGTVAIVRLPDNVDGAYVFRNGAPEAFAQELRVQIAPVSAPGCSFAWEGSGFTRLD